MLTTEERLAMQNDSTAEQVLVVYSIADVGTSFIMCRGELAKLACAAHGHYSGDWLYANSTIAEVNGTEAADNFRDILFGYDDDAEALINASSADFTLYPAREKHEIFSVDITKPVSASRVVWTGHLP